MTCAPSWRPDETELVKQRRALADELERVSLKDAAEVMARASRRSETRPRRFYAAGARESAQASACSGRRESVIGPVYH